MRSVRVLVVVLAMAGVAAACAPNALPPPEARPPAGASAGCAPGADRGGLDVASSVRQVVTMPFDGVTRRALVQLPAGYDSTTPAPLILSLHPFLLTPEEWEDYSGLASRGTAAGNIVVSPEGSPPGPRWSVPGGLPGPDDVGFVGALLDRLSSELCIDGSRVFAAGFSAGAAMAEALGCAYPDRIAAIVASGGANLTSLCPGAPGVDTLLLHGTADPIVPPGGSDVVFAPPYGLSIDAVVASVAVRNGCDATPSTSMVTATVSAESFGGCRAGHRVELWKMIGAGHTWAGPKPPLVALIGGIVVGKTDTSIDATSVALDFFAHHVG